MTYVFIFNFAVDKLSQSKEKVTKSYFQSNCTWDKRLSVWTDGKVIQRHSPRSIWWITKDSMEEYPGEPHERKKNTKKSDLNLLVYNDKSQSLGENVLSYWDKTSFVLATNIRAIQTEKLIFKRKGNKLSVKQAWRSVFLHCMVSCMTKG